MTTDRVAPLLGAPDLARLVDALERRVSRGRPLNGRVTLTTDAGERAAIAALFGRQPGRGASMSVDLDRLDQIVRESGAAASLAQAVEQLRGPVIVRTDEAEALRREWEAAHEPLDELVALRPELDSWVVMLRAQGNIRRLAADPPAGRRLLERVAIVLAALPAAGEVLARFAARKLGSAHALDVGMPEASLVMSALSRLSTLPGSADEPSTTMRGAARRRELWATAGIAMDELSSTVLVHRLPLPGPLGELTAIGEPVILTLRQMHRLTVAEPRGPVFVCENPSVVAAAARELGAGCPALVCLQGQPSLAADVLLRQIAGATLRYHGDFDWGGLRIANGLHQRFGFEPWRYGAADLERAVDVPGMPLKGSPVDARWDTGIRPALEDRGTRLEEEQVLDSILGDLSSV